MKKVYDVKNLLDEKEECEFTGTITIGVPSYPERVRFPKDIGVAEVFSALSENDEKNLKKVMEKIELMAACAEKMQPYIVGVALTHKTIPGSQILSVEDLYADPEASNIIVALCMLFLTGFVVKKNVTQSAV